ncbi:similar to Saccharomyces cerevisiae YHR168W MTG2 Putative GTPase, member of the Obg family [Maudiozyma barnettii]|nr:similar to Saccharomyces cerevisiae YHR168W MTG2 Putative GTPase, member of the Obg family [Kazachstania barnettii]
MINLRRISKLRTPFIRLKSTSIPDNAPTLLENEEWLGTLDDNAELSHDANVETKNSIFDKHVTKNERFPIKIISTPPETKYIKVQSPIANFTSINYLRQYSKHNHTQGNFVDVRIIQCRSGNGGNGCVSFLRDANRRVGPPDGGDGGGGGSVYVQAVEGMNSLSKLKTKYIAGDGQAGASTQLDGSRGKNILITVPKGTVVRWCMDPKSVRTLVDSEMKSNINKPLKDILQDNKIDIDCYGRSKEDQRPKYIQLFREQYETGEGWLFKDKTKDYHEIKDWFKKLNRNVARYDRSLDVEEVSNDKIPLYGIDLDEVTDKPVCLLEGGKGGLGNMHFLTSVIRNPRFAKIGRKSLESYFMFELKSIADLGLVGFPNAGKSTILNKISNATPRIGSWEFTTLRPTIGTIMRGPGEKTFTVADIPGIIEGAHLDRGMGLEFLKHIERSKGWVFVIGLNDPDPLGTLKILINEVGGLEKVRTKNILVVCNKADIDANNPASMEKYLKIQKFAELQAWDSIPISALNEENIDVLVDKMARCAKNNT